jgi:hypothetical protein
LPAFRLRDADVAASSNCHRHGPGRSLLLQQVRHIAGINHDAGADERVVRDVQVEFRDMST